MSLNIQNCVAIDSRLTLTHFVTRKKGARRVLYCINYIEIDA